MKSRGTPRPDDDQAAESRHRDTVSSGVMSMATVVLIGMFGLLEIAGSFAVNDVSGEKAKSLVKTANGLIPALSTFVIMLYVWCVISGTDAIINACNHEFELSRRRQVVAMWVFQGMVVLVGTIAGLTIMIRAVAS